LTKSAAKAIDFFADAVDFAANPNEFASAAGGIRRAATPDHSGGGAFQLRDRVFGPRPGNLWVKSGVAG
jgi:hypothetical protein